MNCNQANQIEIINYLSSIGVEPIKVKKNQAWYLSPIRIEKTPSFKVDINKNKWYDFGISKGGSLVDLALILTGLSLKDLLFELSSKSLPSTYSSFKKQSTNGGNAIQIKAIKTSFNSSLNRYLNERGLNAMDLDRLCCEIHYIVNNRCFYGVGFQNDAGGYEIRNAFFKGCIGPKSISTRLADTSQFSLFEGFIDYLTAYQLQYDLASVIVLNSVSQVEKAVSFLRQYTPSRIHAYLDNDAAGRNCSQYLKSKLNNVVDMSLKYKEFKDINEMLMNKNK